MRRLSLISGPGPLRAPGGFAFLSPVTSSRWPSPYLAFSVTPVSHIAWLAVFSADGICLR